MPAEVSAEPSPSVSELQLRVDELEAQLRSEREQVYRREIETSELFQAINASEGNLGPVFDAMLERATRLCQAAFGVMNTYDGRRYQAVALHGVPAALEANFRDPAAQELGPDSPPMRLTHGEDIIHIGDLKSAQESVCSDARGRPWQPSRRRAPSMVVALRKGGTLLGSIAVYRQEVRPFSDREIALLQNFAAHSAVAMENARLLGALREALDRQTAAAEVLKVINASPPTLSRLSPPAGTQTAGKRQGPIRGIVLHT